MIASEKDSLENLIYKTSGDQKIELMIELAEVISMENLDRSLELLREAEKLVTESGKVKLQAKIHYKAGKFLFRNSKYFESIDEYKSSLKIYEELIDKEMIIELALNLGQSHYHLSDFMRLENSDPWQAYHGETYFSAIVIRLNEEAYHAGETSELTYTIGSMFS